MRTPCARSSSEPAASDSAMQKTPLIPAKAGTQGTWRGLMRRV